MGEAKKTCVPQPPRCARRLVGARPAWAPKTVPIWGAAHALTRLDRRRAQGPVWRPTPPAAARLRQGALGDASWILSTPRRISRQIGFRTALFRQVIQGKKGRKHKPRPRAPTTPTGRYLYSHLRCSHAGLALTAKKIGHKSTSSPRLPCRWMYQPLFLYYSSLILRIDDSCSCVKALDIITCGCCSIEIGDKMGLLRPSLDHIKGANKLDLASDARAPRRHGSVRPVARHRRRRVA